MKQPRKGSVLGFQPYEPHELNELHELYEPNELSTPTPKSLRKPQINADKILSHFCGSGLLPTIIEPRRALPHLYGRGFLALLWSSGNS